MPSSYIRFSQTVEESIGCHYDITTDDDAYLRGYNADPPQAGTLSEDDFERVMEVFEDTAAEQTPFASVDNTVVAYDMMLPPLNHLGAAAIMHHAKAIYEYWKTRRQEMGNKPLHPTLKFETHQETDDTDPYVCFRRREARQTRKTRARDNKIAESLKRLRRELEDGRQLVLLSYEREMMKRDLLQMDRAVFEDRARLKNTKVKLGIKGDDEDLINQKVSLSTDMNPIRGMSLDTNLARSLRNANKPKLWLCNGRLVPSPGIPLGQMVGPWRQILSRWLRSELRMNALSDMRLNPRSSITGSGTTIT